MARRTPIARVGNYAAPVDTDGMDESMKDTMYGTPMDSTEKAYVAGAKNKDTATEAVRRARKANKAKPLQE
jgi:hypothetical protein